jgi:GntP family gluconate:H+ symporter
VQAFIPLLIGLVVIVGGILWIRLHAFLALLLAAAIIAWMTPTEWIVAAGTARGMTEAAASQVARSFFLDRVAEGFGRTIGQIGMMVVMATLIGESMLRSGAADRLVRAILRRVGEKRAPHAFAVSGFLLGIPVFFDTVFYLAIPVIKAVRLRTGRHYLWYILALLAGGSMTHSLVPPTPGPLFVAAELKVDLGLMIGMGALVGGISALAGFLFGYWSDRRLELPLRESEESLARLRVLAERGERELPPTWLALMPILLPVVLIGGAALLPAGAMGSLKAVGDRNVALIFGAIVGMGLLHRWSSRGEVEEAVRESLVGAGSILLIVGAGGAFGAVLQQTNIGVAIERLSAATMVLPVAFLMTAIIRTAQGSATVAMITAAGAFAGMATTEQLGFHPVYLALAIGCGSKPVTWLNDSAFWVMTRMSGMTEREGLRTITPLMLVMGGVGISVTILLAWLFPMRG